MIEDRQISVETSGGYRPPTGMGERILLVLAGLALVGGALIAVGNLLPLRDETADASAQPSADATARPSRTPRPRATPTPFPDPPPVIGLVQEPIPDPGEAEIYQPGGWLRLDVTVELRESPLASAHATASVEAGDLVMIDSFGDQGGWVYVSAPGPGGWLPLMLDGRAVGERFISTPPLGGFSLGQLVGGEGGYIASAYRWSSGLPDTKSLASSDGLTWQVGGGPSAWTWSPPVLSWGPTGWMGVVGAYGSAGPRTWIMQSRDGVDWTLLGRMDLGGAYPVQLVASREGYLLQVEGGQRFGPSTGGVTLWFSPDGERWEQRPAPFDGDDAYRLAGIPGGFLAWGDGTNSTTRPVSFSPDGFDWVSTSGGPTGYGLRLAPRGEQVLGVGVWAGGGELRAFVGSIVGRQIDWRSDPSQAVFAGSTISSVAGDGDHAVAVGWDSETSEHRAWQNRGNGWQRMPVPDGGFGVLPTQVAAGPTGYVTVGGRPTLNGINPVFWRSTGSAWRPEQHPILPAAPDPSPSDCSSPIDDVIDFVTVAPAVGVVCRGSEPISFTAWSARCDGCYGSIPGKYREEWLSNPTENLVYLSPIAEAEGYWTQAVTGPELDAEQAPVDEWVRVTGHYDDPAAVRCALAIDPIAFLGGGGGYWGSYVADPPNIVSACRMTFVITEIIGLGDERPSA